MLTENQLERFNQLFHEKILPAIKEVEAKTGKPFDFRPFPSPEVVHVFELENGKFARFVESYGRHQPIQEVVRLSDATLFNDEAEWDYYAKDILKYQTNGLSHDEEDGGSDYMYHTEHPIKGLRSIQLAVI